MTGEPDDVTATWSRELLVRALRTSEDALFRQNVTTLELDALVDRLSEAIRNLTKGRRTFRDYNAGRQALAEVRRERIARMLREGSEREAIAAELRLPKWKLQRDLRELAKR